MNVVKATLNYGQNVRDVKGTCIWKFSVVIEIARYFIREKKFKKILKKQFRCCLDLIIKSEGSFVNYKKIKIVQYN